MGGLVIGGVGDDSGGVGHDGRGGRSGAGGRREEVCRVGNVWLEVWCGLWQQRGETTRGVRVVEIMVPVLRSCKVPRQFVNERDEGADATSFGPQLLARFLAVCIRAAVAVL